MTEHDYAPFHAACQALANLMQIDVDDLEFRFESTYKLGVWRKDGQPLPDGSTKAIADMPHPIARPGVKTVMPNPTKR